MTPIAPTLQAFFTDRLTRQLQVSPRTISSYRDTLRLLLCFAQERTGHQPSKLDWEDLGEPLISAFLDHLETDRGNGARTRNLRLTAIRSLFKYAALRHPEHAAVIAQVLSIPPKRHQKRQVTFLTATEASAMINAPDPSRWEGRRDRAILTLAIHAGLRVSELIALDCGDIVLGTGAHVRCKGKGRKHRTVPLTVPAQSLLASWLAERAGRPADPLFATRTGRRLSRDAIEQRVATHARTAREQCPSLIGTHLHQGCNLSSPASPARCGGVLSIGKVGLSRNQQLYYEQQVARGAEDYYAGRGEAPGRWAGRGADLLGLEGDLDADQLTALMDGKDPATGALLATRSARSSTAGFDLTFSAPKSVSVLSAIGDDGLAGALVDAHEEAVEAALGYLEREACRVRRGHGGARKEAAAGFVAAAYRHRMSRAQDPQLHTHVVVANMGRGADGRWTALDGRPIFEHAKAAGYLYEAHLRRAVIERLPWVSWGLVREGIAELEQVPEAVREEFSQRRRRILERERELEAAGVAVGAAGRERIVFDTREPKREVIEAEWRAEVRARAAEHGLGREQLELLERLSARGAARSQEVRGAPVSEAALAEWLFGPTGLTASRNTFAERDVVMALAEAHQHGASTEALIGLAGRMLDHPEVVQLGSGLDRRYTTRELLRAEEVIVGHATAGMGTGAAVLDDRRLGVPLETLSCGLTDEQAAVVAGIAVSGNQIDVVEALAGTGKTTAAAALREVYERAGYRVIGAAPTGRAVRELKERAGIIQSRTLHGWAVQLETDPEALVRGGPRESRGRRPVLLIIDEAGMANTRVSAQVIDRAMAGRVKVVAIGDSGQLSSVQAGGWLAALSRRVGAFELREVMRQRDPAERQALADLHRGKPESFLALKQERGDLQLYAGEQASVEAERWLVGRWSAARIEFGDENAVMISRDNRRRERLNQLARDRMRQEGKLGHETELAGKQWAVGDRVIARRNDRARDLDNGMRGTITTLDQRDGATVRLDSGGTRQLDPEYLARHVEHAYALTGHGMQGGTVQWAAVIGRPEDFSRNWAYTALSRAREPVEIYLVDEPGRAEEDRREIAPENHGQRASALERLGRRMHERDDEDLALEHLEQEDLETRQFVSPAREQIEPVRRQIHAVQEQLAALPIQEAKHLERIASRIAAIERAGERDRRPRGLRDRSAHRWRKHERDRDLERLREEQAQGLERVPDPRAVLDRQEELSRREGRLISEVVRLHEQAAADEIAARPPWLETTLGPEPTGWLDRERWQDTALKIGWHRVREGITDPHVAIDERDADRSLTREIAEARVELGLDARGRGHDHDQGYGMEW